MYSAQLCKKNCKAHFNLSLHDLPASYPQGHPCKGTFNFAIVLKITNFSELMPTVAHYRRI